MCVAKAGQGSSWGGGHGLWVQVFGSSQPGTLGPSCHRNQAWGPSWGTPTVALLLSWPLMLGAENQESRESPEAEGLWRWGWVRPLWREESRGSSYQASVLESQCFTVFDLRAAGTLIPTGPCARQTGPIGHE